MRIVSSLLVVVFFVVTADTAYVVLKDGKKGRIDIPYTSELYNSNLNSFQAVNKNGNYNLLKQNVEYLVIGSDTLRFVGNVAQRIIVEQNDDETISDELPAPLKNRTPEIIDDQNIDEEVESHDRTITIGVDNEKSNMHLRTEMESNRKVAIHGLVVYCVSMGLQYGIALPLSISAANNSDTGMAVGSLIVSSIGWGMSISGSTRCGVSASLTYDSGRKYHIGLDRNINWGFYKVGWALKAVYSVMYVLSSTDQTVAQALGFPAMLIDMASTGMFLTSVANASHYSRTGLNKVKHSSLKMDFVPVVSVENKYAGMVLNCSF